MAKRSSRGQPERSGREHPALEVFAKRRPTVDALRHVCPSDGEYCLIRDLRLDSHVNRLKGVRLHLTGVTFTSRSGLFLAELAESRFSDTIFMGSLGGTFTDCKFERARFRSGQLVTTSTFTGCRFDSCNFERTDANHVTFSDCIFAACEFRDAEFLSCVFDRCGFPDSAFSGGTLGFSQFRNSRSHFRWQGDSLTPGGTFRSRAVDATEVDLADTLMGSVTFT